MEVNPLRIRNLHHCNLLPVSTIIPYPPTMPSLARRASLYVVHHSGFLDSFLDASEHSLVDCTIKRHLLRSETLIESAPLLSQGSGLINDLPIPFSLCHSPWPCLGQKRLIAIRGTVVVYLLGVLCLGILHGCKCHENGNDLFFDARYIILLCQIAFYWITTVSPISPLKVHGFLSNHTSTAALDRTAREIFLD